MTENKHLDDHWMDALEVDEAVADTAEAMEHVRAIEALARKHGWTQVLDHLLEIECALPGED